jgi:4-aminobutyrate aminotransferase-like enzyme
LEPRAVAPVKTKYRRVVTKLPVPESLPLLEGLRAVEPVSMRGQPPVVWDRAEGFQVFDKYGNMWLDFSSGVLITNAGHGRKEITDAIVNQAKHGLLTSYCFPNEARARLAQLLVSLAPKPLNRAFILTTGSETLECVIKLSRTLGAKVGGKKKITIVSFERAFHGRTLGAQMIGGIPALKTWIHNLDVNMVQVPFPDGFRTTDVSFELFLKTLKQQGVHPDDVCAVVLETYQGGGSSFAPVEYIKQLRAFCDKHKAALVFDEVQAGFGRCGTFWGFEYYGVVPDLFCMGKGISSSLPVSAVLGKSEWMDLYGPNEMTSTHTGNPVCAAAAVANIELIRKEKLHQNAANVGGFMHDELQKWKRKYPQVVGAVHGRGLVAGIHMVKPGGKDPNESLAWNCVRRCFESGVLFFCPVGFGGATWKIAPPLTITKEAMIEALGVMEEALAAELANPSP